jgi:hypothetical protein
MASWYLKQIIVHDLQTREKEYFICEKWLAVEKEDGKIERLLPVSGESQKLELKYLAQKQAKKKLTDGYLWFSIFTRPLQSSLTRKDRTTNCFVLLFLVMFSNTMYFTVKNNLSTITKCDGFDLGTLMCINISSVSISIIINLVLFMPTYIILEIFKKSKPKKSRINELKELIGEKENMNSKSKNIRLPWWAKIVGYILSFIIIGVSIFFTIMYGITMGNDLAIKCFSSIIISFVISILITGPLKAFISAILFSFIFRKLDDSYDGFDDPDDDCKEPINNTNFKSFSSKKKRFIKPSDMDRDIILPGQLNVNEMRKERMKTIQFNKIFKDALVNIIQITILFLTCYLIINNNNSFVYNKSLQNTLNYNNKLNKVTY